MGKTSCASWYLAHTEDSPAMHPHGSRMRHDIYLFDWPHGDGISAEFKYRNTVKASVGDVPALQAGSWF